MPPGLPGLPNGELPMPGDSGEDGFEDGEDLFEEIAIDGFCQPFGPFGDVGGVGGACDRGGDVGKFGKVLRTFLFENDGITEYAGEALDRPRGALLAVLVAALAVLAIVGHWV